jgi:sortase A
MVSGRGRFSVLFLAIAALMFCLALVLTPSSRAQNQDNSTTAVAGGGEDCVDFEGQDNGTGTGQDTGTDDNEDTNGTSEDTTTDASDVTEQSQQNGNQDTNSDQQTQQDGNQDGQQTQGQDGNNECVIASTVPDQSLLPTGAPAKSNAKETTAQEKSGSGEKQGNSDRDGEQSDRSGEQTKTDGGQKPKSGSENQKKTSSSGKKLEIEDHGKKIEVQDRSGKAPRQEKPETPSKSASASANDVRSEPAPKTDLAPRLAATKWTRPSREEIAATDKPRSFTPGANTEMTLSVRAMGLYNVPVANSNRLEDLDKGLVRVPKTSQPWDSGHQRNVYVAGHYLGQPETQSRLVFYNLDELKTGDELVLKDGQGRPYKYRVSEKFATGPEDSWVMGQVRGRDMVTLQTCIPPDFGKRLVVRADRVRT